MPQELPKSPKPDAPCRVAYLFSRFPVISQTFCDTEMLALEAQGLQLVIGSINPPKDDFRHEHLSQLQAEQIYNPPGAFLKLLQRAAKERENWPAPIVFRQHRDYGAEFKCEERARNALYLAREFARRGVGHVHVHFTNRAAHTALFLKQLTGIPFSVTAHAQDFMVDLGSDDLLRELIAEAEFFVAVSEFSRHRLCEIAPDHQHKIHRIYNGMNLARFPDYAVREPGKTLKIVSIGRLIEFKGFHKLIEACGQLRDRWQIDFQCDIIGDGPWHTQLQEQINEAGLRRHVRLCGSQSQDAVRAALRRADVFALASLEDSQGAMDILPTVILEAMASGLPVVSTSLAGIPEMVEHGKTGLLVEPGDAAGLADALGTLLANSTWRGTYGQAGRRRVEEIFDVRHTSGELHQLFAASLEKASGNPRIYGPHIPAPSQLIYLVLEPLQSPEQALAFAEELLHLVEHPLHPRVILAAEVADSLKPLGQESRFLPALDAMTFLPPTNVLIGLVGEHPEVIEEGLRLYDDAGLPNANQSEAALLAGLLHWQQNSWQSWFTGAHIHVFDASSLRLAVVARHGGIIPSLSFSAARANKKSMTAVTAGLPLPEVLAPPPESVPLRWGNDPVHNGFLARHQRDRGFWKGVAGLGIPTPRARHAAAAPERLYRWADGLESTLNNSA